MDEHSLLESWACSAVDRSGNKQLRLFNRQSKDCRRRLDSNYTKVSLIEARGQPLITQAS